MAKPTRKPAATGRAEDARTKLIRAIQAERRKVAAWADDDAWRDALGTWTGGTRSLRQMTVGQLGTVMHKVANASGRQHAAVRQRVPAVDPQVRKLKALWLSLYNLGEVKADTDAALLAWLQQRAGVSADALVWLPADDKRKAIDMLRQWAKRVGWSVPAVRAGATEAARIEAGLEARRRLCRCQWQRLGELGAIADASLSALDQHVGRPLSAMGAPQLDKAATQLGRLIRRSLNHEEHQDHQGGR